jgi:cytochrome c556
LRLRRAFVYADNHSQSFPKKVPAMICFARLLRHSALISVCALAACSQSPEGGSGQMAAAVDEDSPEYRAYQYRDGLMHVIGNRAGIVRGMAGGNVPVDNARFVKAATDLAALATMVRDGFPAGSGSVAGSRSLPDIWTNAADFENKIQDFEAATVALADLAQSGGFAAAQASVEAVAQSCGGCHRPYRADE